jgi:hypothetical protein
MRNKTLVEDRLDGSSNFRSWKSRLQITLEEDDLLSVIQKALPETTTDEEKEEWKEDDVKARKIIIYSMRDHLLPHIANVKTTYEMYDALKNMFESNNTLRALTLKTQLQNIKMTKDDIVATFFMKISEIRDQLGAIGETISDRELVLTTLNALPKHWEPFLQSINGREELPTFDRLWTNYTQKKSDLKQEECKTPLMMTIMLLPFIQRKEEIIEEASVKHSQVRRLHQLQVMIIEKTNQRSSVSDVTSMDTLREIVLPGRNEDNLLPLLMLIQSHIREMKTSKMRRSSSEPS